MQIFRSVGLKTVRELEKRQTISTTPGFIPNQQIS